MDIPPGISESSIDVSRTSGTLSNSHKVVVVSISIPRTLNTDQIPKVFRHREYVDVIVPTVVFEFNHSPRRETNLIKEIETNLFQVFKTHIREDEVFSGRLTIKKHLFGVYTYKSSAFIDNIFISYRKPKKPKTSLVENFILASPDHLHYFAILEYPSKMLLKILNSQSKRKTF